MCRYEQESDCLLCSNIVKSITAASKDNKVSNASNSLTVPYLPLRDEVDGVYLLTYGKGSCGKSVSIIREEYVMTDKKKPRFVAQKLRNGENAKVFI